MKKIVKKWKDALQLGHNQHQRCESQEKDQSKGKKQTKKKKNVNWTSCHAYWLEVGSGMRWWISASTWQNVHYGYIWGWHWMWAPFLYEGRRRIWENLGLEGQSVIIPKIEMTQKSHTEMIWKLEISNLSENVSQLFKKGSLFISVLVVAIPIRCQDNHSGRVSDSGGKIMSIRVSMMRKPVSWHFSSLRMECEKLVLASGTVGCCAAAARHRFCAETAVSSKEAVKTQASSKMSLHILFSQVWRITLTVCMFVFSSAYINGYFCVCVCVSVSVQGGGKRDNAHRNSRISVLY